MGIIKFFSLGLIFGLVVYMGNSKANEYINRLKELISIKAALNIFESKIKFTQAPLEEIFTNISENCSEKSIKNIFQKLIVEVKQNSNIHKSWENVINTCESNLTSEDKKILIDMGKILGATDLEGQVSNIKITSSFIDIQIKKAEKEKEKNVKLCRTLGIVLGLTIIIILI